MTGVIVAVCLALTASAVARWLRLGLSRDVLIAAVRAGVQLAAVGAVIALVFEHEGLSALFAITMVGAASATSRRRLASVPNATTRAAASIVVGAAVGLVPLLASGAFSTAPREFVPVVGILVGGAMVATSITATRVVDAVRDQRADLETRLALGVSVRTAAGPLEREAVRTAVVGVIDQTKSAGLVTLPGTFVGLVLGGASPTEAARVQLVVLLALLAVQLAAALTCARLAVAGLTLPGERIAALATSPSRRE
jgi:putative ABC transport system permease protein